MENTVSASTNPRAILDGADPLAIDLEAAADSIAEQIRESLRTLGRRGAVVATSGGIDSCVSAALAVRALGRSACSSCALPERDIPGNESSDLGLMLADHLGAPTAEENISAALEGMGCYRWRDEAIRRSSPSTSPTGSTRSSARRRPADGRVLARRREAGRHAGDAPLPSEAYRLIIAATNMKQRVRKLMEYS